MKKLALLTITVIIRPVSNFIFHIRKWLNTEITQGLLYRLHVYPITRKESLKRNGEIKAQRRFDHILSSLRSLECRYIHEWRENKLSDHSPIEAVLDIQS